MIPGRTLHRIASLVCSPETLDRVVEPAIADLQKEYESAADGNRRVWALLTGYSAVLKVIAVCALSVSSTTPDEHEVLRKTLAWSAGWVAAISTLLMLPPLLDSSMRRWDAALALVPQAMPLAIPMGIAIGIAFGLSARPERNVVKVALLGAVIASALSFAILAWVMPATNHAFRQMAIRELRVGGLEREFMLQKGHNEMTLAELRREEASFAAAGQIRLPRQFAFAFHVRFALAVGTLVLASLLLAAPFNHRGARGLIAFAASFGYVAMLYTGETLAVSHGALPPIVGAWLPNVVLTAIAFAVVSSRSSRLRGSGGQVSQSG